MARLRPVPAARHASPATFVHKDLHNCTHVFLRQDATHRALEPPYSGPYLQLLVRSKPVTVSADGIKPAYVLNESDHGSSTFNSPANTLPATPPVATLPPPPILLAPVATYASLTQRYKLQLLSNTIQPTDQAVGITAVVGSEKTPSTSGRSYNSLASVATSIRQVWLCPRVQCGLFVSSVIHQVLSSVRQGTDAPVCKPTRENKQYRIAGNRTKSRSKTTDPLYS
jgi:hypothetical protein